MIIRWYDNDNSNDNNSNNDNNTLVANANRPSSRISMTQCSRALSGDGQWGFMVLGDNFQLTWLEKMRIHDGCNWRDKFQLSWWEQMRKNASLWKSNLVVGIFGKDNPPDDENDQVLIPQKHVFSQWNKSSVLAFIGFPYRLKTSKPLSMLSPKFVRLFWLPCHMKVACLFLLLLP